MVDRFVLWFCVFVLLVEFYWLNSCYVILICFFLALDRVSCFFCIGVFFPSIFLYVIFVDYFITKTLFLAVSLRLLCLLCFECFRELFVFALQDALRYRI